MSYNKNTWAKGDVITANKLNHMEDGIAGAGYDLVIRSDKTFDNGSISDSDLHLDVGSYDTVMAKIKAGGFINAKVYVLILSEEDGNYYWEYPIERLIADEGYNDCIIVEIVGQSGSTPGIGVRSADGTSSVAIYGAVEDNGVLKIFIDNTYGISFTAPWHH